MSLLPDSKKIPTLCLNMIVKNESKILTRLFESVAPFIDSYLICDTGSTDNTVDFINQFFSSRDIPGKVVVEPFKNFGYNRSFALEACRGQPNSDYILLLDADMCLTPNKNITGKQFKESLKDDVYFMFQGNDAHYYKNVRIVKNNLDLCYWGVTHEYVKYGEGKNYHAMTIEKSLCFISDFGDGGCKQSKFERDISLLLKGLEESPNNARYLFYLANSYKDTQQWDLAIETYRKRILAGEWFEEIWQSYFQIGHCYKHQGKMDEAIIAWLDAYQIYPARIENLYEIIHHYRSNMKYQLAFQFYKIAEMERKKIKAYDFLFLHKDVYDWKIDYEYSIIAYYRSSSKYDIQKICMKVLAYPYLEDGTARNVLMNYKFYATKCVNDWITTAMTTDEIAKRIKPLTLCSQSIPDTFVSSTPTFCMNKKGELVSLVRYVNYKILENGGYHNQEKIETINVISIIDITSSATMWIKKKESVVKHNASLDNLYVGLEDMRLYSKDSTIYYNANRGLGQSKIMVEHGKIDAQSGRTYDSVLLENPENHSVEKNWTLCEDVSGNMLHVYSWFPLITGVAIESNYIKTKAQPTPLFFKYLRGSTNGIRVGGEIWFLCHSVSYEDRRFYYHIFVVLDADTLMVKKYSPLFTLEGQRVEYSLGFIFMEKINAFFIGYSLYDRETKYTFLDKTKIEGRMIMIDK